MFTVWSVALASVGGVTVDLSGLDYSVLPMLTPSKVSQGNAVAWSLMNRIRLGGGEFTLEGRAFLAKPMMSRSRRKCMMKGTQQGGTQIEVLSSLHGMIMGRYSKGVLYLFPTEGDVTDFSKSRFNPLISDNRESIGRYVRGGGQKGATDTANLKRVGDAFLYLRGARLTQESAQLRSIPVDRVVFDEVDKFSSGSITEALGRIADSELKEESYLSNPTEPGRGIAPIFDLSDQEYWTRHCVCGHWYVDVDEFLSDAERVVGIDKDGKGFIRCPKCGVRAEPIVLNRGDGHPSGEWVAKMSSRTSADAHFIEGYQMSHFLSARIDPGEVLHDFRNPKEGDIGNVYRLRLGLPYIEKEEQLRLGDVYDCCGSEGMEASSRGPCAMGWDVGSTFHVVIGVRSGPDRFDVLKMLRLPAATAWQDLRDLALRYHVVSEVGDLRPYEDSARKYRTENRGRKILLCVYTDNAMLDQLVNEDTGIVKVFRTGICDKTHRMIVSKSIGIPRRGEEVEVFAQQCCRIFKVGETDKKTGTYMYRYSGGENVKARDDHYYHALNYFLLAAQGIAICRRDGLGESLQENVENEYVRF